MCGIESQIYQGSMFVDFCTSYNVHFPIFYISSTWSQCY